MSDEFKSSGNVSTEGNGTPNEDLILKSLAPEYRPKVHEKYVKLLDDVVNEKTDVGFKRFKGLFQWIDRRKIFNRFTQNRCVNRNIALSGAYGTGKSSILREFMKRNKKKAIGISLAPLAAGKPVLMSSSTQLGGKIKQREESKTSGEKYSEKDSESGEIKSNSFTPDAITDRLEREIVKQLLYSVKSRKLPLSNFHRIRKLSNISTILLSSICGSLGLFLLSICNVYSRILIRLVPVFSLLRISQKNHVIDVVLSITLFSLFVIATAWLLRSFGGWRVHQISTGGTSLTFSDENESYFDKNLDEIVYFFEQSGKRIVVFEDLDRFNNPEIFDSLRELNNILNAAVPTRWNKVPVRFIYAIKDSVFSDQYRDEIDEDLPFARTKFFDVIIPIVPFVSSENASRLAMEEFKAFINEDNINPEVLSVAGEFIPDMRILINIRNEYTVYREILDDPADAGLDYSHLLAFLIYKNTYLADAVKLQSGTSVLDKIYKASTTIAKHCIEDKKSDCKKCEKELSEHGKMTEKEYMKKVSHDTQNLIETINSGILNSLISIQIGKQIWSIDNFDDIELWKTLNKLPGSGIITFTVKPSSGYGNNRLQLSTQQLVLLLNEPLYPFPQNTDLEDKICNLQKEITNLRSADMKYLLQHDEYVADINNEKISLQKYVEDVLGKQNTLLQALLSKGWLNRDYLSYSTMADSEMTPAARNFINHHVDNNNPDPEFLLDGKDAEVVFNKIRLRGSAVFSEQKLWNYQLFDYMLSIGEKDMQPEVEQMLKSLAQSGDEGKRFIKGYLFLSDGLAEQNVTEQGKKMRLKTVAMLTPFYAGIFELISTAGSRSEIAISYFDTAMRNISSDMEYNFKNEGNFENFLYNNFIEIKVFRDKNVDKRHAENIAKLCKQVRFRVKNLAKLSQSLREEFVKNKLYEFNRENVLIGLKCRENDNLPSLDFMKNNNDAVYSYTIENLDKYLYTLLKNGEHSLDVNDNGLLLILNDVKGGEAYKYSKNHDAIENTLLLKSTNNTKITNIIEDTDDEYPSIKADVKPFMPALLRYSKIIPSFINIEAIILELKDNDKDDNYIKALDAAFRQFLKNAKSISASNNINEERKQLVAIWLINSFVSEMKQKIELVTSLNLSDRLDVKEITIEDTLEHYTDYAQLLSNGIISDEKRSWERLKDKDWMVKESYLAVSDAFSEHMADWLESPDDVCQILKSVNNKLCNLKEQILNNQAQYLKNVDSYLLYKTILYVLKERGDTIIDPLVIDGLKKYISKDSKKLIPLRETGLSAKDTVNIFSSWVNDASISEVFKIIRVLDGEYLTLMDTGRKVNVNVPDTPYNHDLILRLSKNTTEVKGPLLEVVGIDNEIHAKRKYLSEWKKLLEES